MTPPLLIAIGLAVLAALVVVVRRFSRYSHASRAFDLGAVSTRWLAELRRDEPWTR